jgi:predicted alpha/beta hydrolase family esterase
VPAFVHDVLSIGKNRVFGKPWYAAAVATQVLILPGIGGSGPEHWQSVWEREHPSYQRIEMPDWDAPELEVWVSAIEAAVKACSGPTVIVAHSLGCLALAHGALLVAVPDPAGPEFPDAARSFVELPLVPFGFPTRVVASRNDPYGDFEHAMRCAAAWQAELFDVGSLGHINADSQLGRWSRGQELLRGLLG